MGLDEELTRLRNLDPGQLLERHRRPVVLDVELLDEGGSGPARANRLELRLDVPDGLVHLVDGLENGLFDHWPSVTVLVPPLDVPHLEFGRAAIT